MVGEWEDRVVMTGSTKTESRTGYVTRARVVRAPRFENWYAALQIRAMMNGIVLEELSEMEIAVYA